MAKAINEVASRHSATVAPHTPILEVSRRMRDSNVASIIIADERRLAGVVTDRDVTVRGIAEGLDPATTPVSRICSWVPRAAI